MRGIRFSSKEDDISSIFDGFKNTGFGLLKCDGFL